MVRKYAIPAALLNRYVRFADFLDYMHFGVSDFRVETRQRFGKVLCTLLTVAVIFFAVTILISIIVSIVLTAKSKNKGTSPTPTHSSEIHTTVPPTFVTTQSSADKDLSTTSVKRALTTGSEITTSSLSFSTRDISTTKTTTSSSSTSRRTPTTKTTTSSPGPRNASTTKTSTRTSTLSSTTIYISTAILTENPTASSTISTLITTTIDSTTNDTEQTTTTKPPGPLDLHCACAVDFHNIKKPEVLEERKMVVAIGEKIADTSNSSSVGFWAYGRVSSTIAERTFEHMFESMENVSSKLSEKADKELASGITPCYPGEKSAVDHINRSLDARNVTNCLLFFSGIEKPDDTWWIQPNYTYTSIVLISLRGVNLTNNVDDRGVAFNIDLKNYNDSDITELYNTIKSRFKR